VGKTMRDLWTVMWSVWN